MARERGMTENIMATSADNPGVVARPPLLYGAALVIVLVCRWFWPMPISGQAAALWPGLALAALGVGIAIWGRRTMRAAGTNINPALPATAIVTSGPFRFSRNPLYFALTMLYLGLTLAFNTWWGVVVLVPLLIIMHRGVVLREERYLEEKFGESYRVYKTRVRRWL
jgi:protein-S-isoprenylcysteine O-methyltransferase Ste14